MQYTRCQALIEPKVGGSYKILDGQISGEFKNLEQDKLIHLTWKFSEWPTFSNVTISFTDRDVLSRNIPTPRIPAP